MEKMGSAFNESFVRLKKVDVLEQRKLRHRLVASLGLGEADNPVGLLLTMWSGVQGSMTRGTVDIYHRVFHGLVDLVVEGLSIDLPWRPDFDIADMLVAEHKEEPNSDFEKYSFSQFAPAIFFSDVCLIELDTVHRRLRQTYLDGAPSPLTIEKNASKTVPYMRFCFRTGNHMRSSEKITLEQSVSAYRKWRKDLARYGLTDYLPTWRGRALAAGGFEAHLRITWQP